MKPDVYVSKICIPMEGVIEENFDDGRVLLRITSCRDTKNLGRLVFADLNYWRKMDDEDHLRAACWNLLWALNQHVTHPELDDRFAVKMKSSNDEPLITVVCSSCGMHFEAPTEWWVRKRSQYTNIPDGVMTTCPHCGNVTIVREVKSDE